MEWLALRHNAVPAGLKFRNLKLGDFSFDDMDDMPFTTLPSAQMAEWQEAHHLCHHQARVRVRQPAQPQARRRATGGGGSESERKGSAPCDQGGGG